MRVWELKRRAARCVARVTEVAACPHDHLLVENNDTKHTCQKCGAIMKYVPNGAEKGWSRAACKEWCDWFGPHWAADLKVNWRASLLGVTSQN